MVAGPAPLGERANTLPTHHYSALSVILDDHSNKQPATFNVPLHYPKSDIYIYNTYELNHVANAPPPLAGLSHCSNSHRTSIYPSAITREFLDKSFEGMSKHGNRKNIFLNSIAMAKLILDPTFTGITEIGNGLYEININDFSLYFDVYRYICNLVPIKDKSELWRKLPEFEGEACSKGNVRVRYLEYPKNIIYEDIQIGLNSTPKRAEIESLFQEIQNSPETRTPRKIFGIQ